MYNTRANDATGAIYIRWLHRSGLIYRVKTYLKRVHLKDQEGRIKKRGIDVKGVILVRKGQGGHLWVDDRWLHFRDSHEGWS